MEPVLTNAVHVFCFLNGESTVDRVALIYVEVLQVNSAKRCSVLLLDFDLDGATVYWRVQLNRILQVHLLNDCILCQIVLNRAEWVIHHEESRYGTRVTKLQDEMRLSLDWVLSADCADNCEVVDTRVVQFHVN